MVWLCIMGSAWAVDFDQPWPPILDFAKLDSVNANNAHPQVIARERLEYLLRRFTVMDREQDSQRAFFSEGEIKLLSARLSELFGKSQASDDVIFATTSNRARWLPLSSKIVNAGRFFISDGRLNLIIGMCEDSPEINTPRRSEARHIIHGSRIRAVRSMTCSLQEQDGVQRMQERSDWASIALNQQARATPEVFAADKVLIPQQTEQRLTQLKRLFEQGLISEAEYQSKRQAVLNDL